MTQDYQGMHPTAPGRVPGFLGATIPALRFDLATDRGPVTVEIPPEAVAGATVISRITFTANDSTVFSMPLFTHPEAVPLHTICTAQGIELGEW